MSTHKSSPSQRLVNTDTMYRTRDVVFRPFSIFIRGVMISRRRTRDTNNYYYFRYYFQCYNSLGPFGARSVPTHRHWTVIIVASKILLEYDCDDLTFTVCVRRMGYSVLQHTIYEQRSRVRTDTLVSNSTADFYRESLRYSFKARKRFLLWFFFFIPN